MKHTNETLNPPGVVVGRRGNGMTFEVLWDFLANQARHDRTLYELLGQSSNGMSLESINRISRLVRPSRTGKSLIPSVKQPRPISKPTVVSLNNGKKHAIRFVR